MEHFIRIAFWIFTLLFTLSGCKSTPIPFSADELNIDFLRKYVKCESDTKLYSPKDVMPRCFTSALECVHKELFQTAKDECEDKDNRIGQGRGGLEDLINKTKSETGSVPTTSNECACEKWAEVPFDEFLNNYETLIQLIVAARKASR